MKDKHIAVYITGGIACYKAAYLVRALIKAGAKVRVAMTQAAQKMVTPLTFATLSQHEVYTDFEMKNELDFVAHISLADWTDYALVVPATANTIAKIAGGIADDFVSTALLATSVPKFIVPAMNDKMWNNPATQRNLAQLQADGIEVLEPAYGFLAEGYDGKGRMPEPEVIFNWFEQKINTSKDLADQHILISAGSTSEPIDPVRCITNISSGKMGYALAKIAAQRGAQVTLVSGPTNLDVPVDVKLIRANTAKQMQVAMQNNFVQADLVIMAAAVADYRVAKPATQKIKKNQNEWLLKLVKNPDILSELGQQKQKQFLVGFAAETQDVIANGQKKLAKKNLDLLVANDVSRSDIGFNAEDNQVTLLRADGTKKKLPKANKAQVANWIYDEYLSMQVKRGEQ